MPDLLNYKDIDAENILREKNLTFNIVREPSATIPKDYVVRQVPTAGTVIDDATSVTVYVSTGTIEIPKLSGMTLEEAKLAIEDAGLIVGKVVSAESDKPKDTVIGQSVPAGMKVVEAVTVDIRVSSGEKETSSEPESSGTSPSAAPSAAPAAKPSSAPITVVSPNAG